MGKKVITTALGDIMPENLGVTSMHEHFFQKLKGWPAIDDTEYLLKEVEFFKEAGGQSLVDGTAADTRCNIEGTRQISRQTGINMILATGSYRFETMPDEFTKLSDSELRSLYRREIYEGIDGTDSRAGCVKCALDKVNADGTLSDEESRYLRLAAETAAETGRSLHMHLSCTTVRPELVLECVDKVLNDYGVLPDKLEVLHIPMYAFNGFFGEPISEYVQNPDKCRNANCDLAFALLDKGVNLGFEGFNGHISIFPYFFPDNYDVIKMIYQCIKRGFADHICIGHDAVGKITSKQSGHNGYTGIFLALPEMEQLGISKEEIHKILVDTPARILSHDA